MISSSGYIAGHPGRPASRMPSSTDYPPLLCSVSDMPLSGREANPLRERNMHVVCQPLAPPLCERKVCPWGEADERKPFFGQTPNFIEVLSSGSLNRTMYSAPGFLNVVSSQAKKPSHLATPSSSEESSRTLLEWKARAEYLEHQLNVFMKGQTMFKGVPVDWSGAMELVHVKVCALEKRVRELRTGRQKLFKGAPVDWSEAMDSVYLRVEQLRAANLDIEQQIKAVRADKEQLRAANLDMERRVKAVRADNEDLVRLKTKKGVFELQSTITTLRLECVSLRRTNETLRAEVWELSQMLEQRSNIQDAGESRLLKLLSAAPKADGWFNDNLWSVPADGPYFFK